MMWANWMNQFVMEHACAQNKLYIVDGVGNARALACLEVLDEYVLCVSVCV